MKNILTCSLAIAILLSVLLPGCAVLDSLQLPVPEVAKPAEASQPLTVSMPVGPSAGKLGEDLTYTVSAKSNIGEDIVYGFYWGDGSYTWSNSAIASHSWSDSGVYVVRVQARCSDVVSEWSTGKAVMVGSAILSRRPLSDPEQAMRYVTPHAPEIESAVQSILSAQWRWAYSDSNALREWVATQICYQRDGTVYGVSDYWQLPVETLERGTGDCEDIAILLCSMLRASGVGADEVYVAVGRTGGTNSYHAYLFERYSKGIWRMIEPQIDADTAALTFELLDWALTYDYSSDIFCFNDKYCFDGAPALSPGIYETELLYSFWPFTRGASVQFERQLEVGEKVQGSIEWFGTDKIMFNWDLAIRDPDGKLVLAWSGKDIQHDFVLLAATPGIYTIEIRKKDFITRCVRLIVDSTDWRKLGN